MKRLGTDTPPCTVTGVSPTRTATPAQVRAALLGSGTESGSKQLDEACGRGLYLIRKLVDAVQFNERGNSICMILRRP